MREVGIQLQLHRSANVKSVVSPMRYSQSDGSPPTERRTYVGEPLRRLAQVTRRKLAVAAIVWQTRRADALPLALLAGLTLQRPGNLSHRPAWLLVGLFAIEDGGDSIHEECGWLRKLHVGAMIEMQFGRPEFMTRGGQTIRMLLSL